MDEIGRAGSVLSPDDDAQAALQRQSHLIDVIHELALAILGEQSLDDLVWLVAKSTISKLGLEDCVIYLMDESRNVLVQRAAFGPKSPEGQKILNPIEIPFGEGIVGTVAETRHAELIADTREDSRYIVDDEPRLSELTVPIVMDNRVLGVIDSEHSEVGFFTKQHLDLLTIIASMASTRIAALLTIERLNETVSQLERTRNALRNEERRFRELYNKHPSMFFSVDASGTVVSVNDYACQELGFERHEIEGRSMLSLLHVDDTHSRLPDIELCLFNPSMTYRYEASARDRDGRALRLRLTVRGQQTSEMPVALMVAEDITEAHRLSQELQFQATHDSLTGLLNRRAFEHQVEEALDDRRLPPERQALFFLDLDRFKIVNDSCGHAAGDTLLRHVAQCLSQRVRRSDVVGRIGGDEFAVLIKDCSLAEAQRSAEGILKLLAEHPFHWNTETFTVGASIGVASLDVDRPSVDQVFSAADAACLSAKEHGRNRVHVFRKRDGSFSKRRNESQWVARITRALSEDSFLFYGQPIVNLNGNASSRQHHEILLRMKDEDGELVLPGAFISAAERFGLAPRIDEWVVERALQWLRGVEERGISINLSGASIGASHFLDFTLGVLRDSGVDPGRVCFELTETVAVSDPVRARTFVDQLKQIGCRFALDDFGSGLSSFGYLKTFPVDYLKIDGVLIQDVAVDELSHAMVRSINDMGHLTGKKIVAEFVHDEATLDAVKEIGVDFVQGYAIGYPEPLQD